MLSKIIICTPGTKHRFMTEEETGRQNYKFGITEFDKALDFEDEYTQKYIETTDLSVLMGEKEGRKLFMNVYANQPVTRVSNIQEQFTSSSLLFNPESKYQLENGFLIPDIDIITLEGNTSAAKSQLFNAATSIVELYKQNGWNGTILDNIFEDAEFPTSSPRFPAGKIIIPNPEEIIKYAQNVDVRYEPSKLYFMKEY